MKINLKAGLKEAELEALAPRQPGNTGLEDLCKIVAEVYDVPGRWDRDRHAIGERLFRRLHQYLRESNSFMAKDYTNRQLLTLLDRFVASLHDEDLGKEPYAFAMTWWMAALAQAKVEPHDDSRIDKWAREPFIAQVVTWRKKADERSRQLGKRGQQLRGILPKP